MGQGAGCVCAHYLRLVFLNPVSDPFASGAVLCIGGPALVTYLTPSEEELFKASNLSLLLALQPSQVTSPKSPSKYLENVIAFSSYSFVG